MGLTGTREITTGVGSTFFSSSTIKKHRQRIREKIFEGQSQKQSGKGGRVSVYSYKIIE